MGPSRLDPQALAPCTSASPSPTSPPPPQRMWTKAYHPRARRIQRDPTNLLTAMRTAAAACGFQQHPHADDDRPPTSLGAMLHDLWHGKQQLATLLHTNTPQSRRHIRHCRTQMAHIRAVAHPQATAHCPRARTVCAT